MGYFSWKTSDTKRSIPNRYSSRDTFPVFMVLPDGRIFREDDYEGYGVFGGRDFFGLVAELNGLGKPEQAVVSFDELESCGHDVYTALAIKQQALNERFDVVHRGKGINLYNDIDETELRFPKLVEDIDLTWVDVPDSEVCEHQGYFYDD